jgi:dTDP-4-dehydrorhamnose 3,5-epimerase
MEFVTLEIEGVLGIIAEFKADSRGSLIRVWDSNSILGSFDLNQSSIVTNPTTGTLRGLHYQAEPFSENKVIECVSGKVFDVIVDLREESPTYGAHLEVVLGPSEVYSGLFVPAGCAHGYLTLEPFSTLIYFMDKEYSSLHARGLIWDDPKLSIGWPNRPVLISERDTNWTPLDS